MKWPARRAPRPFAATLRLRYDFPSPVSLAHFAEDGKRLLACLLDFAAK